MLYICAATGGYASYCLQRWGMALCGYVKGIQEVKLLALVGTINGHGKENK